jgi:hypothetical protein
VIFLGTEGLGLWVAPNVVITFALSDKLAADFPQRVANLLTETLHATAGTRVSLCATISTMMSVRHNSDSFASTRSLTSGGSLSRKGPQC